MWAGSPAQHVHPGRLSWFGRLQALPAPFSRVPGHRLIARFGVLGPNQEDRKPHPTPVAHTLVCELLQCVSVEGTPPHRQEGGLWPHVGYPAGGSQTPDPLVTQTTASKPSPRPHEVFFLRETNLEKQIRVITRIHREGISNPSGRGQWPGEQRPDSRADEGQTPQGLALSSDSRGKSAQCRPAGTRQVSPAPCLSFPICQLKCSVKMA